MALSWISSGSVSSKLPTQAHKCRGKLLTRTHFGQKLLVQAYILAKLPDQARIHWVKIVNKHMESKLSSQVTAGCCVKTAEQKLRHQVPENFKI